MDQILNKINIWWIQGELKKQETKLNFYNYFLPIKTEEIKNIKTSKIERCELKKQSEMLPHEIIANIKSDYLLKDYETQKKAIEEKYYWKNRALVQTLKRKQDQDQSKLVALENEKNSQLLALENKFNPTDVKKSDIDLALAKIEEIKNKYSLLVEKIEKKYDEKLSKYISITKKNIEVYKHLVLTNKSRLAMLLETNTENKLDDKVILKLDNLSMHFGGLKAVNDLSFEVKEGEIFGLIGPNGAGKTTVFNCITKFYKPTSGEMYFKNKHNETVHLNDIVVHNIIKEGIVRTFQNVEMIWELNVIENLLVAAHTGYRSGFFGHLFNSRLLRQEEVVMRAKAMKILEDLELTAYAYQYPMGLPYGILKKIELARTLMVNPKLIILDEPAAGLNDTETDALAKTIHKIRDEYNTTIFLVEHDMGLVMEICDTVCAISFGKKLAIGTPKEIQNSKVVREAYLGGE